MCKAFLPLLDTSHGRLVNVSSIMSRLSQITDPALAARLRAASSISAVDALMNEFVQAATDGDVKSRGWPTNSYGVSKMGVTALTRTFAHENPHEGLLINSCCPGYVATDMTKNQGGKTPKQGAKTPVHLALGDLGGRSGEFWYEMKPVDW
jgi:carbonyl reductase 1